MFMLFTPFTYLFFTLYLLIMVVLLTISNFYMFWLYMELMTLLFMGMMFTLFTNSYTQLMLYFLVQTLASFNMLIFYIFSYEHMFVISLLLKLSMFPFFFWYINVVYRFPNFPLFFVSTLHKLPPLLMTYQFLSVPMYDIIISSSIFTMLFGGFYMLTISDLRYLLVVSSMVNNSWLLMSLIPGDLSLFMGFFFLYSLNMLLAISLFGSLSKISTAYNPNKQPTLIIMFILLSNLASLPPLPMFLAKFAVVYNMLVEWEFELVMILPIILFLNVIISVAYIKCYLKYLVNIYSSLNNIMLY